MTEESTSPPLPNRPQPLSESLPSQTSSGSPSQTFGRSQLPDIVLPEPSRVARVMMMLRALGILLLGVGVVITALVVRDLVQQNQQNNQEAQCRAEILNELTAQESKINATGWTAMLAAFRDDDRAVDLHASALEQLLLDLPELRDKAAKRFDICS